MLPLSSRTDRWRQEEAQEFLPVSVSAFHKEVLGADAKWGGGSGILHANILQKQLFLDDEGGSPPAPVRLSYAHISDVPLAGTHFRLSGTPAASLPPVGKG